ncbi:MAG: hemagglutinin/hemolysin-related protein, partial [Proteobacteria bacterium]|nr:hemagglutinin/hemolysin-related protein [Pseudomonadota bacterium]
TIAPSAPTVVAQTTSDTTPTITGTAEVGSTVSVTVGGATYSVTANGSGQWSVDTGSATPTSGSFALGADGAKTVGVTSTDAAGNSSSGSGSFTLDTTAPTVSSVAITSATGLQNNTLNVGDVVSVTVTMSEATTVAGTPQLALNIGGATVQANYASGSGTTALVFTYTIAAGQTDANGISVDANGLSLNGGTLKDGAGNDAVLTFTAVSDNAGYLVDTSAPSAPTVASLGTTSDTTPTITGTAEANATVELFDGLTSLGTTTADGSGNWSFTPTSALSEGTHTITAKATDLAGNTSGASSSVPNLVIDTIAPSAPTVVAQTTSDTTPTITGTAEVGSTVSV